MELAVIFQRETEKESDGTQEMETLLITHVFMVSYQLAWNNLRRQGIKMQNGLKQMRQVHLSLILTLSTPQKQKRVY